MPTKHIIANKAIIIQITAWIGDSNCIESIIFFISVRIYLPPVANTISTYTVQNRWVYFEKG